MVTKTEGELACGRPERHGKNVLSVVRRVARALKQVTGGLAVHGRLSLTLRMSQPGHLAAYRVWTSPCIRAETLRRKVSSLPVTSVLVSNGGVGKRLLNVEEAAGYLGLKVDTVYKKARLRELPFVKVGRALRFDKQALDRLIEQHTIKTID